MKTKLLNYNYNLTLDYRVQISELSNKALEGTSSMVHDRSNKIIYMSVSERADKNMV